MIPIDNGEPEDESRPHAARFGRCPLPEVIVDHRRTAYPFLRRIITAHLRDVGDFVALHQPEAARSALQMALAVRGEIEITPEGRP
jgi:hypothetical protein